MNHPDVVVLDDDPTGTQSVSGVPVVLDWSDPAVLSSVGAASALYMLTNSRALDPEQARSHTRSAVEAVLRSGATPQFVLRGDSTLRGHMKEEYLAVHAALAAPGLAPYVLVPALPSAGRVTVGGVHHIERDGHREPLAQTEYARDPVFSYTTSSLLHWAEERSGGFFPADAGLGLSLLQLRDEGPRGVVDRIERLAERGGPAVFAPDAETDADIAIITEGVRLLAGTPAQPVVRSAPTLAAQLSGHAADHLTALPEADDGVVVICGSHVPMTTHQLAELERRHPGTLITADLAALDSASPEDEISSLARAADRTVAACGLAVVATPRELSSGHSGLASSRRIAGNLARVLHGMTRLPRTVVAKGGITSAVVAQVGLGASTAWAAGPVMTGLAQWNVDGERGRRALIVFPGNVGGEQTLAELVDSLRGAHV